MSGQPDDPDDEGPTNFHAKGRAAGPRPAAPRPPGPDEDDVPTTLRSRVQSADDDVPTNLQAPKRLVAPTADERPKPPPAGPGGPVATAVPPDGAESPLLKLAMVVVIVLTLATIVTTVTLRYGCQSTEAPGSGAAPP